MVIWRMTYMNKKMDKNGNERTDTHFRTCRSNLWAQLKIFFTRISRGLQEFFTSNEQIYFIFDVMSFTCKIQIYEIFIYFFTWISCLENFISNAKLRSNSGKIKFIWISRVSIESYKIASEFQYPVYSNETNWSLFHCGTVLRWFVITPYQTKQK